MKKLNLRLWRMIIRSKGQYISILTVVITGLLIYTALNNASTNLETSLNEYYKMTGFADVYIQLMNLPERGLSEIRKMDNIKEAEGRIVVDAPLLTENRDEKVNVRIISVSGTKDKINGLYLEKGKREISGKTVLLLKQFAEARKIKTGDEIDIQLSGRKITFKVGGLVSSPEFIYLMENEQSLMPRPEKFGIVFIEKEYLGAITGMNGSYNEVIATLKDYGSYDSTEKTLENRLEKYGVKRIIQKDDQLSNSVVHEEINGLKKVSGFLPVVFLFTAAAILATIISRTVRNDRMSIGVLKALGFSDVSILLHYTFYAAGIGIIGGLIGIFLGTVLSGFMTQMYLQFFYLPLLKIRIYPLNIVNAIFLSAFFCILAGLFGARGVLKISPAEAMKPEAPKQGSRIVLERMVAFWRKLSFTWKVVFRNIFREKKRMALMSLGAASTVALSLTTFWMTGMMNSMFNEHYGQFMTMDYNVSFTKPVEKSTILELDKIIGADSIEGKIEMPFELSYGRESNVVGVLGLKRDTGFYSFKDMEGNPVTLPESGLLISSNLAGALKAKTGDRLLVKNYIPGKKDTYVEIRGVIKQSLGINAYMDLDYMERAITGGGAINGAMVKTQKNIIGDLFNLKNISNVQSLGEMKETFLEYLDVTLASIVFMLLFSGLLGFVITYSMSVLSINERRMEFASLRVLGFSAAEIFGIILKENIVMSLGGIVLGIPLGGALINAMRTFYVTELYTFDGPITLLMIIGAVVYTLICLFFAQLSTRHKISKLNFIEALKNRTS